MTIKISVKGLGLSLGIVCGICMLVIGILGGIFGIWTDIIEFTATFYVGFDTTPVGIFLGVIYGFVDGFIGGIIIAWLYNRLR